MTGRDWVAILAAVVLFVVIMWTSNVWLTPGFLLIHVINEIQRGREERKRRITQAREERIEAAKEGRIYP